VKRHLALALAAFVAASGAFAQDFAKLDALHDDRKLGEELTALNQLYSKADPQAAVVFRLIRCIQEIAVQMPKANKSEKLAKFDEAINFGKPLLEIAKGNARDRAKVYYWFGVSMGNKGTAMGVLNALFMAGDMRANCDKSLAIDPSFADPYYLKAKIDDAIPPLAGGDKTRMGTLYAKAIELDPSNVYFLADFAVALKGRNKNAAWNGDGSKGVPAGRSDMDHALEMAKRAKAAFAALPKPSLDQREKMDDLKAAGL
jgi:tetratricopeptide (TPR) repeat protein